MRSVSTADMQGFAPGALTEQPLAQRANAGIAVTLAEEMGVYGFKPNVMDDIISGKRVSIRSSIATFWRTLGGDISPLDMDIAMQMIYRLFTSEVGSSACPCVSHRSYFLFSKITPAWFALVGSDEWMLLCIVLLLRMDCEGLLVCRLWRFQKTCRQPCRL